MFGWSSGWEQCPGSTLLLEEKRFCIEGLECVPLLSSPVSLCWCSNASPPPSYPFWPVVWENGAKSCSYGIWVTLLGETDWNLPPWPGTIVTIYMSYLMTGGPGKEHVTNKLQPTRKNQERSKGDTMCPITSQNPSCWHPSWLSSVPPGRTLSNNDWPITTWKLISL